MLLRFHLSDITNQATFLKETPERKILFHFDAWDSLRQMAGALRWRRRIVQRHLNGMGRDLGGLKLIKVLWFKTPSLLSRSKTMRRTRL
ncbi:MAG: hypothetical protein V8T87_04740 [Victivallales bacterium]